jgi:hypothetical protein
VAEVRQKQIAELQEKRAQEDHIHVTEMHKMVLESIKNQQEEIAELKQLMAEMGGKTYEGGEQVPVPDLYALHPRGEERFENDDHLNRMRDQLHHNHLVSTVRKSIVPKKIDH